MRLSPAIVALFSLVLTSRIVVAAEDPASQDAAVKPSAAAEMETRRRDLIRYGTDSEILKLVTVLEEEKAEYLDEELLAVLEATKNGKITSTVLGYFGRKNDPRAEARALKTLRERDLETNEAVEAAINYLGLIASREAPPALRDLLDAEEARFMEIAVRSLGRTGGVEADVNASFLLSYYDERETNSGVKQAIIGALGALGSKKATTFLKELARNGDETAVRRMAALESIGKIGDGEALDAVLESLTASDPNVRSAAVAALGPFSGEKVDAAILEAFRDSYYKTRSAAAKAAGERKMGEAVRYLRYRAERDEVSAVKEDAVQALGKIGNADAMDNIRSIFDEKKNTDRLRIVAAEALLQHEGRDDASGIIAALEEAQKDKRKALYNGLLKALSGAKSSALENLARRLLSSEEITDKLYGLELAKGNEFRSLSDEIKKLAEDEKNATLSRRAKDVLVALGMR